MGGLDESDVIEVPQSMKWEAPSRSCEATLPPENEPIAKGDQPHGEAPS
jgi:hypothetical protein